MTDKTQSYMTMAREYGLLLGETGGYTFDEDRLIALCQRVRNETLEEAATIKFLFDVPEPHKDGPFTIQQKVIDAYSNAIRALKEEK